MAGGISDILVTILVLAGLFLLAYSAIRKQGILDTFKEIKEMFEDKATQITEIKYG